jgi:hypothetical protein
MLRENKGFEGVLTRFAVKSNDQGVCVVFNIRHSCPGDIQVFLDTYEDVCKLENIRRLFTYPVQWKNIQLDARERFELDFDEVHTEATLKSIKIRRTIPKKHDAKEMYTYDFSFEKYIDPIDDDLKLGVYLNQKEEDENGKKKLMLFLVYLTHLGADVEKIPNISEILDQ